MSNISLSAQVINTHQVDCLDARKPRCNSVWTQEETDSLATIHSTRYNNIYVSRSNVAQAS